MTARPGGIATSDAADRRNHLPDGDRKFVVALARGLEVLRAFRPRDGFLGNQEIAERTGLPKPTVTRLTYTLCELGYLTNNRRLGKYQLAPSAITLGYSALANLGIRHIAREFMDEAAEALAAPVALGALDRNKAIYVDISRGTATFTVQLDAGSRIPLPFTAMGRALLVALDENERAAHLESLCAYYPGHEDEIRNGVQKAVEEYAEFGFVVSVGEWRSDINGVAVPLVAADGSGTFAFNCGAPPHHFSPERLYSDIGPAVAALATVVDDALNGRRTARPGSGWLPPIKDGTLNAARNAITGEAV